jgi:Staphylococcal nuclease homologue
MNSVTPIVITGDGPGGIHRGSLPRKGGGSNGSETAPAESDTIDIRTVKIELAEPRCDKYFRILAKVMADGQEVAQELVKTGLAVSYDGGKKRNWWAVANVSPQ